MSPRIAAASIGRASIVQELLKVKADVDAPNQNGVTGRRCRENVQDRAGMCEENHKSRTPTPKHENERKISMGKHHPNTSTHIITPDKTRATKSRGQCLFFVRPA